MGYASDYLCEAGTTIVGRKGTINKPIFVNRRFWNVDTAFGITPGEQLNPKYLYYFCQHFNFTELDKSTTIPSLAKRDLLAIEMPVPPLEEQQRIVARIEELFSQLDDAEATLQKTKAQLALYRQAVLNNAFLGKFTSHVPIHMSLDWAKESATKTLSILPKEWHYIELAKLGSLERGKSKHRPRNDKILFESGKYPFIQTGDVKSAQGNITSYSQMYGERGLQQSKLWPKGTLCITIAANIAESAFLGIDACFPDSIVGFIAHDVINPKYVRYFIESQKVRLWAFAPATAQKNINLTTLEQLIVPYCELQEQQAIIDVIDERMTTCDYIENMVNSILIKVGSMKHSILKNAFQGAIQQ